MGKHQYIYKILLAQEGNDDNNYDYKIFVQ